MGVLVGHALPVRAVARNDLETGTLFFVVEPQEQIVGDIAIDDDGRPWVAMSNNPAGTIGLFGTLAQGPSLRGVLTDLSPLPLGGHSTLSGEV